MKRRCVCQMCNGKRYTKCSNCGGTGVVISIKSIGGQKKKTLMVCKKCKSTGIKRCWDCSGTGNNLSI